MVCKIGNTIGSMYDNVPAPAKTLVKYTAVALAAYKATDMLRTAKWTKAGESNPLDRRNVVQITTGASILGLAAFVAVKN